jgi:hypothetical protein
MPPQPPITTACLLPCVLLLLCLCLFTPLYSSLDSLIPPFFLLVPPLLTFPMTPLPFAACGYPSLYGSFLSPPVCSPVPASLYSCLRILPSHRRLSPFVLCCSSTASRASPSFLLAPASGPVPFPLFICRSPLPPTSISHFPLSYPFLPAPTSFSPLCLLAMPPTTLPYLPPPALPHPAHPSAFLPPPSANFLTSCPPLFASPLLLVSVPPMPPLFPPPPAPIPTAALSALLPASASFSPLPLPSPPPPRLTSLPPPPLASSP